MKLGVIGCGKMGTALVGGAVKAGVTRSENITGHDPFPAARDAFVQATGATITESAAGVAEHSDVILLATKPQDIAGALAEIATAAGGKPLLVISIAAGVTLTALENFSPENLRIIRAMPNTPALVGKGAAGYCLGSRASEKDGEIAKALLGSVGMAVQVQEKLMDAVTGLSGSGPAYIYLVIEALADGGVKAGLSRVDAIRLAAQTVAGAAAMVTETGEHPAVLKDMVTSPGGTTIAGLAELEKSGVRSAFIGAVDAATKRSIELGAK